MTRERSAIAKALGDKGFGPKDGDHEFYILWDDKDRKTRIHTKLSRGSGHKEIGDDLLAKMAKQCRLTKAQFLELIDCTMSGSQYLANVKAAGHIDP